MIKEYYLVAAISSRGEPVSRLIDKESICEGETVSDYFPANFGEIRVRGLIQMAGDTEFLDEVYVSEF